MRRKLLLSGIVISVLLCFSVIPSAVASAMWSQIYDVIKLGNVSNCLVVATSDGGYALLCTCESGIELWLAKTDALGNIGWNRTYGGGTGHGWANSMIATSDAGYAIAGATWSDSAGMADFWLIKTDALGNAEWNRTYGGSGHEEATSVVETIDKGYAITGRRTLASESEPIMLVKTDASGNMQWSRTYGKIFGIDLPLSIFADPDGGYAIASSFWLMKTDAFGDMLWNRTFEGLDADSVVVTSDGGFALAGMNITWNGPPMLFALGSTDYGAYMNGNGTCDENNVGSSVQVSEEVNPMASETSFFADLWLAKTDALGNMQWNRTYGENRTANEAYSLVQTSDGGYAIAGRISSPPNWDYNFWLVKTDEFGVVPEYSSGLIPALMLTTIAIIIINRKKLLRIRS